MTGKYQFQPGGLLMPGAPLPKYHPVANLFPMLDEEHRESFRKSLAEQQNHPIVLHQGMILDGRNRARELILLGKPISYVVFVGTSRQALDFVIDENLERRQLKPSQLAMVAADIATLKLGDNQHTAKPAQNCAPALDLGDAPVGDDPAPAAPVSQTQAADIVNVSRRSVQTAMKVKETAAPEVADAVRAGQLAVSTAADIATLPVEEQKQVAQMSEAEILAKAKEIRKDKNEKRRAERSDRIRKIAEASADLPTGCKFPLIYFDPPTEYEAGDSDRSTENHYPTMTEEEIAALPISELATDDAVLLMWTTVAWLRKSLRLIEGWGFEYKSAAFWDKVHIGLGFWWRDQVEVLLVATRGNAVAPANGSVLGPNLYTEKKGKHSAKPAHFRERIDAVPEWKDWPKVELFARGELPEGWHGWGNEARVTRQQTLGLESEEQAA